jgi:hypothetical protein
MEDLMSGNCEIPTINIEQYKEKIPSLSCDEFKKIFEGNKSVILFNDSIWENTLKYILTPTTVKQVCLKYSEETEMSKKTIKSKSDRFYNDFDGAHYENYKGSYAQDVMGFSDETINDAFEGDPDMYWNID